MRQVTFYDLTDAEIAAYLATGDYADKAGAYGIQSLAGAFVKAINGDYYSIVGFPIGAVNQALKNLTETKKDSLSKDSGNEKFWNKLDEVETKVV